MKRLGSVLAALVLVVVLSPPALAAHTFGYILNEHRISVGLRAIPTDSALCATALWRSQDMLVRNYFSHDIPNMPGRVFAVLDKHKT